MRRLMRCTLQRLRGPYTLREGLAAYQRHLGLTDSDSAA